MAMIYWRVLLGDTGLGSDCIETIIILAKGHHPTRFCSFGSFWIAISRQGCRIGGKVSCFIRDIDVHYGTTKGQHLFMSHTLSYRLEWMTKGGRSLSWTSSLKLGSCTLSPSDRWWIQAASGIIIMWGSSMGVVNGRLPCLLPPLYSVTFVGCGISNVDNDDDFHLPPTTSPSPWDASLVHELWICPTLLAKSPIAILLA